MTIYDLKPAFQRRLTPVVDHVVRRGVTPNALTAAGFAVSVSAGAVVVLGSLNRRWLLAVPALLLLRMALNAMDGMVARTYDQATPRGRVFNEVGDVAGDSVAYLPTMLIFPPVLVALVVVTALIAEFAAVLSGLDRYNQGPLGKSDRAAAFGTLALIVGVGVTPGTWSSICLLAMTAAGLLTIGNRIRRQI